MRVRFIAVLAIFAVVAAACGGRLSEEAIQAELTNDAGGIALNAGAGGGAGSSGGDFTSGFVTDDGFGTVTDDGGVDPITGSPTPGATDGANQSGGGATPGSPSTGGAATTPGGGPAPTVPPEGNGGATDVGVTENVVTLGNVATLSGPVPGLFRGALIGTQAAVAYQNSLGGLYGRTFTVKSGDDNFDAGKNRSVHKGLVNDVFAMVGSFSLFDGASASEIQSSGVLDLGRALSLERQSSASHIPPVPFQPGWPSTGCEYLKKRFGDKIKKMAFFWGNADASRENKDYQKSTCEKSGFEYVYEREFQATESNFTADVVQMRNLGVEGVMIVFDVTGIARFFKSLAQQGFNPPIKYPSPAAYDSDFVRLAGAEALEGAIIGQNLALYLGEDASLVPEVALLNQWMKRVDPNQKIDIFAAYGWMAARLLFTLMERAGPKATRAGVLAEAQKVKEWNNFGLTEVNNVADKQPGACEVYMEVQSGAFKRIQPAKGFQCTGTFVPFG